MPIEEMSNLQVSALLIFMCGLMVGVNYVLFHNWMKSPMINKVMSILINVGMLYLIALVAAKGLIL